MERPPLLGALRLSLISRPPAELEPVAEALDDVHGQKVAVALGMRVLGAGLAIVIISINTIIVIIITIISIRINY